jgi:hypothetical protein
MDQSRLDVKPAVIMTGSGIRPGVAVLVALGVAKPIRLFIEHRVEGLFDGITHHRVQMGMNLGPINLDDLTQALFQFCRCLLVFHFKPFL